MNRFDLPSSPAAPLSLLGAGGKSAGRSAGGWFKRKTLVLPTARTCLIAVLLAACGLWMLIRGVHPFLAVEERFGSEFDSIGLLCIEGWAPESVFDAAASSFRTGRFERIAVTGGPVQSQEQLLGSKTYASLGAQRLKIRGVPEEKIIVSEGGSSPRRRTFHDIGALQRLLLEQGVAAERIQVISTGIHTRRTRLLYRRIFNDGVDVRGFSIPPEGYSSQQWWKSSEGLKTVIMECISWVYEWCAPAEPNHLEP